MQLISIDPGKSGLGWASFFDSRLIGAGIFENITDLHKFNYIFVDFLKTREPRIVVVEVPQIYQQRHWKGDPNDLVDVAVIVGVVVAAASAYTKPQLVKPHSWKGNRPKATDNMYTLSLLKPDELKVVEDCGVSKSKLHNVIDAVGIGLWKLGRRSL